MQARLLLPLAVAIPTAHSSIKVASWTPPGHLVVRAHEQPDLRQYCAMPISEYCGVTSRTGALMKTLAQKPRSATLICRILLLIVACSKYY